MLVIPAILFPAVFARLAAGVDLYVSFMRDYLSKDGFQSSLYNMIACDLSETRKLVLAISDRSHGLTSIHSASNSLQKWVNFDEIQTFILDIKCPQAETILKEADKLNLFRKPFTWLLIGIPTAEREATTTTLTAHYEKFFDTIYLPLSSDLKTAVAINTNSVKLKSFYKITADGPLIAEDLGSWTQISGFNFNVLPCTAIRRSDLRQNVLATGVVFEHITNDDYLKNDLIDRQLDGFPRASYAVIREVAEMMNLRLSVKFFKTWGVLVGNGTWDGMVGDLQLGKIEIMATPLFLTANRMHMIEYIGKVIPIGLRFIFLSPPLSYSNNIFTLPFHTTVWICSIGMMIASSVILYLALKVENRNRLGKALPGPDVVPDMASYKKGIYDQREDSLSDIVLLNIGAICMQGTDKEPQGHSGRIITIFLYFAYMFLYVSYSACIVALLQSSDTSMRTLKDLLNSPLTLGVDNTSYARYYFKIATDEVRKAIYEKRVEPTGGPSTFMPLEEGIKKMQEGLFAFHAELNPSYHIIQRTFTEDEKCGLQVLEMPYLLAFEPYFAIKKFSPFSEIFKIGLHRLAERGYSYRQVSRLYAKKPICTSKSSSFVSVGMVECYPAFKVLVCGLILAVILVFGEKFLKRKIDSRRLLKSKTTKVKWERLMPLWRTSA